MTRTLIYNGMIVADSMGEQRAGYMIIEGTRIANVETGAYTGSIEAFDDVIDASGKVAIPGLINTHGHAAMVLLRGYADDLPLMDWLQKIWPIEEKMTPNDIYWGTQLAIAEMLLSGTTCFTDMYFHMDEVAKAVEETGIRAMLGRGLIGVNERADQSLEEGVAFARRWQGAAEGRIATSIAPHAPYTCPSGYLRKVIAQSEKYDLPLQIHLSETAFEVEECRRQFGISPIELMETEGIFTRPTIAAHCVHVDSHDLDILASRNVRVAHNPGSNLKLASGVAPLISMLDRGVTVGLGTDGAGSNNKLDIFSEMRLVSLLHKGVLQNPLAVSAPVAFQLATSGGANVLMPEQRIGMLEVGAIADVVLVDLQQPHLWPAHNLLAHLVYAADGKDVSHVFVNGRKLVENRRLLTIDLEQVKKQVNRSVAKLCNN